MARHTQRGARAHREGTQRCARRAGRCFGGTRPSPWRARGLPCAERLVVIETHRDQSRPPVGIAHEGELTAGRRRAHVLRARRWPRVPHELTRGSRCTARPPHGDAHIGEIWWHRARDVPACLLGGHEVCSSEVRRRAESLQDVARCAGGYKRCDGSVHHHCAAHLHRKRQTAQPLGR